MFKNWREFNLNACKLWREYNDRTKNYKRETLDKTIAEICPLSSSIKKLYRTLFMDTNCLKIVQGVNWLKGSSYL